jgi:hypothetical protein
VPGRPPRDWFARCTEDVRAVGSAADPNAVCGATWARKSPAEKRYTTREEEGDDMSAKKKKAKKKKTKLHGAALAAWNRKHHPKKKKASPRKKKKKTAKKRCPHCGHAATHGAAGCTHFARGHFCPCTSR